MSPDGDGLITAGHYIIAGCPLRALSYILNLRHAI